MAWDVRATNDLEEFVDAEPLTLEWPADGTVTDGYGPRWGRTHQGIDIGILDRLDVRAATASGWPKERRSAGPAARAPAPARTSISSFDSTACLSTRPPI